MKAIVISEYGGAAVLKYEEVEKPVFGDNQVLIQVKAAALNPIDSKIRNGYMKAVMPMQLPFTPGWEAAGVVAETGKNITGFKKGDEVFTRPSLMTSSGGYAEYVAVNEADVALKPKSLSFTDAAALPLVASAAYICLFRAGELKGGQKIFILGASGSVGLLAVQLAKWAGAYVIGTATGAGKDILKSFGADEVIDYATPNYTDAVREVDLALDLAGGPAFDDLWKIVKKGGKLLSTTMQPAPEKAAEYGITASFVFTTPDKDVLKKFRLWLMRENCGQRSEKFYLWQKPPGRTG